MEWYGQVKNFSKGGVAYYGLPFSLETEGKEVRSVLGFLFGKQKYLQFSSVTQLCLTLCDPKNCSTLGLPVYHQLQEFTQTHVHRVDDATNHLILCRPLLHLPSIFPSVRVFSSQFFASGGQSIGISA